MPRYFLDDDYRVSPFDKIRRFFTAPELWVLLGIVALVVGALYVFAQDEAEWQSFAKDHNCVEVGSVSSSITSGGDYIPGKTGYKCDDGKEYWR